MVHRSLAPALVIVAAGCGADGPVVILGPDAAGGCPTQCNPLAARGQQGCSAGQKCTALLVPTGGSLCPDLLDIGCVPEGGQALGAACTWTQMGGAPGYDTCVAGALCASDAVCRDICGFGGGAGEACADSLTCLPAPGRFEPRGGGEPRYGVCARPPS